MNLREEILKEHSKIQTQKIANYIGNDSRLFSALMELFFSNEYLVSQRAAWVVTNCFEKYPVLIVPYIKLLLENLKKDNLHAAVKRNTLRMFQYLDIPKNLQGIAFQNCLNLLIATEEPVAVKVFAMTVLANICKQEPDLKNELKLIIEEQLPYGSAGFRSRGKKTILELNKLK